MVATLNRYGPQPLWQQLRDDLTARLEAGEFDDTFPGELALTAEYEVSRHTVREALRRLRETGVVTAARGRAPKVSPAKEIDQPLGALYSMFAAVEATGSLQVSVVRRLEIRADAVIADRLDLEGSTPLLYLERQRLADGEPLALDRVWLPASVARPLLRADFTHTSLYDELARRCSIRLTGGRESLHAVIPTPAERRLLGIDERTAAFAIERLATVDGAPTEWRHTLVRGDRFSVSAQFSGRAGYHVDLSAHHTVPTR